MNDISTLLRAWSNGDQRALEELTSEVYDELRRLARRARNVLDALLRYSLAESDIRGIPPVATAGFVAPSPTASTVNVCPAWPD